MPPELAQWINPAILILGFLFALRSMKQMEARIESRMDRLESQMGELRERMAHLEGLLEGLREAITGRNVT